MRLNSALVSALRAGRTAALRALQPFDALHRQITGAKDLPPLWLRRHVGPIAGFQQAHGEIAAYLALRTPIAPPHTFLDVGCGTGVLIPDVLRALGAHGKYIGFDVHEPSIRWARQQYARQDLRVRLEVAEIDTPYSPHFTTRATDYAFPVPDASVDRMVAKSVWTHLLEPEARHYLEETARVLKPDGLAVISAFLLGLAPNRPRLTEAAMRFDISHGMAAILRANRPTAGVAYACTYFTRMIEDAGLKVVTIDPGYWERGGSAPNFQDLIVVTRARDA